MAVAVVDVLEVVDVDEAERERVALLLGLRQLALEPLVEVAVGAEAGTIAPRCEERRVGREGRLGGRAVGARRIAFSAANVDR
jgi:hypothetical protein